MHAGLAWLSQSKQSQWPVAETILQRELAELESDWVAERALLHQMLVRKDEQIWELASNLSAATALTSAPSPPTGNFGFGSRTSGPSAPSGSNRPSGSTVVDEPAANVLPSPGIDVLQKRLSLHAVAMLASDRRAEEDAQLAWRRSAEEEARLSEADRAHAALTAEPATEEGMSRFERELLSLDKTASEAAPRHARAEGNTETFKSHSDHSWSHSLACPEGALWAEGTASQHLLKGYVFLPNVRAAALFDALLRPEALQDLLKATVGSAERDRNREHHDGGLAHHHKRSGSASRPWGRGASAGPHGPSGQNAASEDDSRNELWNVVLHLPFSWYERELSLWRCVRRHPQQGKYLMALRNGPRKAGDTHRGESSRHGGWGRLATLGSSSSRKPASLIGYNGLLVTEVEGVGARLCFAWCCELPGNSFAERKLKLALNSFPSVMQRLVSTAQAQVPANAARRAELVDTTGDGNVDSLAVDTLGDGIVDTMIQLSDLGNGALGAQRPDAPSRPARVMSVPGPDAPDESFKGIIGYADVDIIAHDAGLYPGRSGGDTGLRSSAARRSMVDDREDFMSKAAMYFGFERI